MNQSADDLLSLEQRLGVSFSDKTLLTTALTHTSYVKGDGRKATHNERMEFLGDAVLELCVSEHLYLMHPEMQEGQMTKARARLVCEHALFEAAKAFSLPQYLRLGHGEDSTGGREKPSVVSDAMEAVIGAIFLDRGMETAKEFVISQVIRLLEDASVDATDVDYKTRLQELIQREHAGKLAYELVGTSGPEHKKIFAMAVTLNGAPIGAGEGATKQSAGQAAAKAALKARQNP